MPMRPELPVCDMLDGRDVVIVVPFRSRVQPLLDKLEACARGLAPLSVETRRANGLEGLRVVDGSGRIRIFTDRTVLRGGRGSAADTVIVDSSSAKDPRVLESVAPMTATAREPIRAVLDV